MGGGGGPKAHHFVGGEVQRLRAARDGERLEARVQVGLEMDPGHYWLVGHRSSVPECGLPIWLPLQWHLGQTGVGKHVFKPQCICVENDKCLCKKYNNTTILSETVRPCPHHEAVVGRCRGENGCA